jgi:hypothetical protein
LPRENEFRHTADHASSGVRDDGTYLSDHFGGRRDREVLSPALNAFRIFMNVLFRTGVILIMHLLGWLVLAPAVPSWGLGGVMVTALVMAVVFTLLFELIVKVYFLSAMASCGVTIFVVPVFIALMGFFTLRATLAFASKLVTAPDDGWFVVLLLGTLIWIAAVPRFMLRKRRPARRMHDDGYGLEET